jgi:hypothetical protein
MAGSGIAKAQKFVRDHAKETLQCAGLPPQACDAWVKAQPRDSGNYKRDSFAGSKYWRYGADLLAKLPKKPKRTTEQQWAADTILYDCRRAREDFLTRHAEVIYRKLTKNLAEFRRVDELVYDASKLVPGLTPTAKQVAAEAEKLQSEKDGVEVDQGIFLSHVLAVRDAGMHLCHAMLIPKLEAIDRAMEFTMHGVVDFGPAKVERQGNRASSMPRTTTRSTTPRPRSTSPFSIR